MEWHAKLMPPLVARRWHVGSLDAVVADSFFALVLRFCFFRTCNFVCSGTASHGVSSVVPLMARSADGILGRCFGHFCRGFVSPRDNTIADIGIEEQKDQGGWNPEATSKKFAETYGRDKWKTQDYLEAESDVCQQALYERNMSKHLYIE